MGAAAEDLMKRFHELEVSQAKLRENLEVFLSDGGEKRRNTNRRSRAGGKQDMLVMRAGNFVSNPYQSILYQLGHGVHICRPVSGEIIYWNRAAEVLYGWKSFEALNRKFADLHIDACNHPHWKSIMERACGGGETWSGQLSFRKRSGELFTAMVAASPLHDNGACIGVIYVSSDASMVNNGKPDRPRSHSNEPCSKFKRVQWSSQPQIASSVSNLAGKVLAKLSIRINGSQAPPDSERITQSSSAAKFDSASSLETDASSQSGSSAVDEIEPNFVAGSEIRWEDLVLGEEIGEGTFGVVYRGLWIGSDVAIKVYTRMDYPETVLLNYRKEVAIMKKLRHPNVLLFLGAVYSPERLAIVTEYLPRGSLFITLHKKKQTLNLRRRLRMALDVVRGMNYLHRRNPPIIHRDLKSSNLLVDKSWTVKVGDFGLSCLKISTVLTTKNEFGTPQWMAPEVLRGESLSEKSDVFSFGVILWELMAESIPWSHLNSMQVVGVVGFMDQRLDIPEGLHPMITSIISDCWASDPLQRPSFQDLVERLSELMGAMAPPPTARRRLKQPPRLSLSDS